MFNGTFCAGMGAAGWFFMIAFWVAVLAVVIWALGKAFPSRQDTRDPVDELAKRFSRGELDARTSDRIREEVHAGRR